MSNISGGREYFSGERDWAAMIAPRVALFVDCGGGGTKRGNVEIVAKESTWNAVIKAAEISACGNNCTFGLFFEESEHSLAEDIIYFLGARQTGNGSMWEGIVGGNKYSVILWKVSVEKEGEK